MLVRIVRRRILRQSGNHRTLCEVQLADVDTEIGARRRLNAVGIFSEVNDIHIQLKDRILVQLFLQRDRTNHLRQLSLDRVIVIRGHILDQLLGDRRTAEARTARDNPVERRTERALPVNAVVFVKALVLDGDKRLLELVRNRVHADPFAVFLALERLQHLGLAVGIRVIDLTVELHGEVCDIQLRLRLDVGVDVVGKRTTANRAGCQRNEKERQERKANSGTNRLPLRLFFSRFLRFLLFRQSPIPPMKICCQS